MRLVAAAAAVLLAAGIAGCGSERSDNAPSTAETTASEATAESESATPEYRVVERPGASGPAYLTVQVKDDENLRAVFDAVRDKFDDDDRGVFVSIDCATGGTESFGNRLANGKYANGALGAAQTGLDEGAVEFEEQPDASCP